MAIENALMRALLRPLARLVTRMRELAVACCRVFFPATVTVIPVRQETRLVLTVRTAPRVLVFERSFSPFCSALQVKKIEAVDTLPNFFVVLHFFEADAAF